MTNTAASKIRRIFGQVALGLMGVAVLASCAHIGMMIGGGSAKRPPESEFGLGPRSSATGLYSATLEPIRPMRIRQLQTVRLIVSDPQGRPIDDAAIEVDGGMPEHGHGLPTHPRVTRSLGSGAYEVEGVKFNMRGWWEMKFAIASAAGADTVVFNIDL